MLARPVARSSALALVRRFFQWSWLMALWTKTPLRLHRVAGLLRRVEAGLVQVDPVEAGLCRHLQAVGQGQGRLALLAAGIILSLQESRMRCPAGGLTRAEDPAGAASAGPAPAIREPATEADPAARKWRRFRDMSVHCECSFQGRPLLRDVASGPRRAYRPFRASRGSTHRAIRRVRVRLRRIPFAHRPAGSASGFAVGPCLESRARMTLYGTRLTPRTRPTACRCGAAGCSSRSCDAVDLVERFGSPLFVTSEAQLRANYRRCRDAFARAWPDGPGRRPPGLQGQHDPRHAAHPERRGRRRRRLLPPGAGGRARAPASIPRGCRSTGEGRTAITSAAASPPACASPWRTSTRSTSSRRSRRSWGRPPASGSG